MTTRSKLAVILHADVVDSTALVTRDELAAHERIQDGFRRFSEVISAYGGTVREVRGDALVAEFSKGSDALCAALAFQEADAEFNAKFDEQSTAALRIGIAMGEVVIADETVTGAGVVLAQRIEQLAPSGGVCVQGAAYETLPRRLPITYESLGAQELKGFPEAVAVYLAQLRPGEVVPRPDTPHVDEHRMPERPSVAVLPFANRSDDPEQEFFADGMAEDLITDLSKVSGIFVVARKSSFAYKGKDTDGETLAGELGVRYLLEGSVRKAGGRVRINAQLVDTVAGSPIWADRYDGALDDAFELQDRVSAEVVAALSVKLTHVEQERLHHLHTRNVGAYELFVRAKATPFPPVKARIDAAREMFEQVIDLDPKFAGGYAGVAWMLAFEATLGNTETDFDLNRALSMARKAIEVDQTFGFSYSALALTLVNDGQYDEAIEAAREAIERQPSDADAHWQLALILGFAGHIDDGIAAIDRAILLNPLYVGGPYMNSKKIIYGIAGDFENAVACYEQNVRQDGPIGPQAVAEAAAGYQALGRTRDAERMMVLLRTNFPDWTLKNWNMGALIRDVEARNRLRDWMLAVGISA